MTCDNTTLIYINTYALAYTKPETGHPNLQDKGFVFIELARAVVSIEHRSNGFLAWIRQRHKFLLHLRHFGRLAKMSCDAGSLYVSTLQTKT